MKKNDGTIVVLIGLAMFFISLLFAGVSAVNAEMRLVKTICRVTWERDGVKQYEPWQDDCEMVQGWVEDGNKRFPQFKFNKDSVDLEEDCIDMWFGKKNMKGCFNNK